jgi:Insertion element 4 transposase N-terminal/Transposase DDE domain
MREDQDAAISAEVAMRLDAPLVAVASFTPEKFEDLRRNIDAEWIEQALHATGTATIRRRRLPAAQVVWLVIGMALFRNRPIHDVVAKLNLALPGPTPTVVPSSVAEARTRLGDEPMEWLFTRCADQWAHASADAHRWQGLALYGVDGSTLRVADSKENRAHFGGSTGARGESGYPLVRAVTLMALRSHLLASVAFGPYKTSESAYAIGLWPTVPDNSLTAVDKGFFAAGILIPLRREGKNRHWLTRAKKNLRWRVLKRFGPKDFLVEMTVSPQARKKDPTLPRTWLVRAIGYQRKGFRPEMLLTSMTDADTFAAAEIVSLYHERWELELGYDEIKTEMLDREESIRSKSPTAVTQELWGIFLAYNLIRLEMERVADEAGVEPTRISFVAAMRLIIDEWLWCAIASPGAIPKHLRNLRKSLTGLILPPRRSSRCYPRAVKIKMSNYARKRPSATGRR